MDGAGRHHLHVRKRVCKELQAYPSPQFSVRLLDHVMYAVAILGPLFTIPQIYTIYAYKTAAGISIVSWGAYVAFNLVWILYGYVHKDKVVTFNSILWAIVNGLVVIGALIYS